MLPFLRGQNYLLSFGFLREQNNFVVTVSAFPKEKNYSALHFFFFFFFFFLERERTELPRVTSSKRTKIIGNILSMRKEISPVIL